MTNTQRHEIGMDNPDSIEHIEFMYFVYQRHPIQKYNSIFDYPL